MQFQRSAHSQVYRVSQNLRTVHSVVLVPTLAGWRLRISQRLGKSLRVEKKNPIPSQRQAGGGRGDLILVFVSCAHYSEAADWVVL